MFKYDQLLARFRTGIIRLLFSVNLSLKRLNLKNLVQYKYFTYCLKVRVEGFVWDLGLKVNHHY